MNVANDADGETINEHVTISDVRITTVRYLRFISALAFIHRLWSPPAAWFSPPSVATTNPKYFMQALFYAQESAVKCKCGANE